jgi:uncharacterized coiled-coil protein SlyX
MTVDVEPGTRPTSAVLWRAYVAGWMVLAAGALGYLIVVTHDPRLAERLAMHPGSQPAATVAPAADASELAAMRSALERLNARVEEVQGTVERQRRAVEEVTEKVQGSAKSAPVEAPAPLPAAEDPPQPYDISRIRTVATTVERPTPPEVIERTTGSRRTNTNLPPLPTRAARNPIPSTTASITPPPSGAYTGVMPSIINAPPPPIAPPSEPQTAARAPRTMPTAPTPAPSPGVGSWSNAPAIISYGPQNEPTPSGPTAITLSRATTLDGLRVSWDRLLSNHPALLAGLLPRYNREADGTYQLLAGPFDDRVAADQLCGALRTNNIPCGVGNYGGNAL